MVYHVIYQFYYSMSKAIYFPPFLEAVVNPIPLLGKLLSNTMGNRQCRSIAGFHYHGFNNNHSKVTFLGISFQLCVSSRLAKQ